MSQKKYKYAIFNGRFMPWHKAHHNIALRGLDIAEKLIIVLGSHNRARTIENPFTTEERKSFIGKALIESLGQREFSQRVMFTAVPDRLYNNNLWQANFSTAVRGKMIEDSGSADYSSAMIGHFKDEGSWWLDKFPQWPLIDLGGIPFLNATDVRKTYFSETPDWALIEDMIPKEVNDFLKFEFRYNAPISQVQHSDFLTINPVYENLVGELNHIIEYNKPYLGLKYGVKFVTVDSVVFCAGHVLLIRRRSFPGKGLWALPGGHLEMNENLDEYAAIRELREETGLKVPIKVLEGSLRGDKVFGHPRRSLIGRVITQAFMFELDPPPDGKFPYVKGMDDADKAIWIPIDEVKEDQLFDDHFQIIDYFKGRTTK